MPEHSTTIEKIGGPDTGHVRATCTCGWESRVWHSRRTTEGQRLAERDAREHLAARSSTNG